MSIGLIGTKIGMTREFMESGQSVPVTVIKVEKGRVIDVIKKEKRGYSAVKLGFFKIKNSKLSKQMKGYFTNEAVVHAPESRTSSPVRIPRDRETMEHPQIKGLYPCGEGAGYAGGIISAAIDGAKCAEKC